MRQVRGLIATIALALLSMSCGSKTPQQNGPTFQPDEPKPDVATEPARPPVPPTPAMPAVPPMPEMEPEVFAPEWKKVGVGQKISFSVAAIDQNLDETRVDVTKMPKSATFDAITQTVTWTPTRDDQPRGEFTLQISQPAKGKTITKTWSIDVTPRKQPVPVPAARDAMTETLLMIRQPKRLEQVNKDWPFDRMLRVSAEHFKWQFSEEARAKLDDKLLDNQKLFESFLTAMAEIHKNPRIDPKSDKFDKVVFGDPRAWQIVTVRPRIDRNWTELRVLYQAVKAPEPTFAMFRIRPTVEFVPPLPRPPQERMDNNKAFLTMVSKHLLVNGGPNPKYMRDQAAHGKAVAALVNELMAFDQTKTAGPHLRSFTIGIAAEAQLGGGSARNADGTYKSGDGWAWNALKPFPTADGKSQAWVNVRIPGFWTQTVPSPDNKTWIGKCAPKYSAGEPGHVPGFEKLCRKTLGFVDLPDLSGGKPEGSKIEANNLFVEHKLKDSVAWLPLDDGRRDLGEENGMTCSQCHIRNFGMHDYADPANVDPSKGTPKTRNKQLATLNFVIVPTTRWEAFTIEFLHHQECRGKERLTETLGADAAKGFGCPLAAGAGAAAAK